MQAQEDVSLKDEGRKIIKGYVRIGIMLIVMVVVASFLLGGKNILKMIAITVALAISFVLIGGIIGYNRRMNILKGKITTSESNRKMGYVFVVLGIMLILIYVALLFIEKRQTSLYLDIIQLGVGFALVYRGIRQIKKKPTEDSPK